MRARRRSFLVMKRSLSRSKARVAAAFDFAGGEAAAACLTTREGCLC